MGYPATWELWKQQTENASDLELIAWALATFNGELAFSTSVGAEDQALMALIQDQIEQLGLSGKAIDIFTLDTGRLPPQTYEVLERNRDFFKLPIRLVFPNALELETFVNAHGPNAFYRSVEERQTCCRLRKVGPLDRALQGKKAWITGLRRSQSLTRSSLSSLEWDEARQMVKINPLATWSSEDVWALLRQRNVPYNTLHDQGFPSIGCEPCTRAVASGEDERRGRWWWEDPDHKECGLHVSSTTRVKIKHLSSTGS